MTKLTAFLLGLLFLGPPVISFDRTLEAALESPLALSPGYMFHIGTWVLGGIVAGLLLIDRFGGRVLVPLLIRAPLGWYGLFILWALFSTIYSVVPIYTVFFGMKLLIILVLAIFVGSTRKDGVRGLLRVISIACAAGWAMVALLYPIQPELVGEVYLNTGYRLTGGIFSDYGSFAMLSGAFLLARILYDARRGPKLGLVALYALSWVFVGLSQTRSTMLGGLVIALILIWFHPVANKRRALLTLVLAASTVFLAVGGLEVVAPIVLRGQDAEALTSLTGRNDAFSFLIDRWRDSPWWGFGYAAGARYHLVDYVNETGLNFGAAHDALSKVLIDLGLIGFIFLGSCLISTWRRGVRLVRAAKSWRMLPGVEIPLTVALLSWVTVHSFVAGEIADTSVIFVCAIVAIRLMSLQEEEHVRETDASDASRGSEAPDRAPTHSSARSLQRALKTS